MRFDGVIESWNDERGFGFIRSSGGGEPLFAHIKAFARGGGRPAAGQRVSFEVEVGPGGRKRAADILFLRVAVVPRRRRTRLEDSPARWGGASLFALPAFFVLYLAVDFFWPLPRWLPAGYAVMSLATWIAYAIDKAAARRGSRRTPERTLHLLALLGGWPGAMVGQQFGRHKSGKTEFRTMFWTTVIGNLMILMAIGLLAGRWAGHPG